MKIPAELKPQIAERVRAKRKAAEMTLADLAAKVGCTHQTIYEIERGGSFSVGVLRAVAMALGVTEAWLLTGKEPKEFQVPQPPVVREHSPLYGTPQPSVKEPEKLFHWVLANASDKWLYKTIDDLRAAKMFDGVALVARELERRKETRK